MLLAIMQLDYIYKIDLHYEVFVEVVTTTQYSTVVRANGASIYYLSWNYAAVYISNLWSFSRPIEYHRFGKGISSGIY